VKKRIVIFAFVILAAVVGYIVGYKAGPERERQRSDMKFRVSFGLRLYQALEAGDTNKALEDVRFVLWSDTVGYERAFGAPTSTDSFARRFADAKAITAQVEPELRQRTTNAPSVEQITKDIVGTNNIMKIEWK